MSVQGLRPPPKHHAAVMSRSRATAYTPASRRMPAPGFAPRHTGKPPGCGNLPFFGGATRATPQCEGVFIHGHRKPRNPSPSGRRQRLAVGLDLPPDASPVSYTHLRAHETRHDLVCRLLLEK